MPGKRAAGTSVHGVAMPDELWDEAAAAAADEGQSVGEVIRRALADWLARRRPAA